MKRRGRGDYAMLDEANHELARKLKETKEQLKATEGSLRATIDRCERVETQLVERTSEVSQLRLRVFNLEEDLRAQTHRANALGEEVRKLCDTPPPPEVPVPLILFCPMCHARHIDPPEMREHRTHACAGCGFLWAPAVVPTVGVQHLPGCKNP